MSDHSIFLKAQNYACYQDPYSSNSPKCLFIISFCIDMAIILQPAGIRFARHHHMLGGETQLLELPLKCMNNQGQEDQKHWTGQAHSGMKQSSGLSHQTVNDRQPSITQVTCAYDMASWVVTKTLSFPKSPLKLTLDHD